MHDLHLLLATFPTCHLLHTVPPRQGMFFCSFFTSLLGYDWPLTQAALDVMDDCYILLPKSEPGSWIEDSRVSLLLTQRMGQQCQMGV
jgi:hypothetical protein